MIQLRMTRKFQPRGEAAEKSYDKPFTPDIVATDLAELFAKHKDFLELVPQHERWNVYYTIGHASESASGPGRTWRRQDVIPFDIDGIDVTADGVYDPRYVTLFAKALKIDIDKCVVVMSGNGLQFIVQPSNEKFTPTDVQFFKTNKSHYKMILNKIKLEYDRAGLPAKMDDSSFAFNRILRFPGTENRKPERGPPRQAVLVKGKLVAQDFEMHKILDLPQLKDADFMPPAALKRFAVDVYAVEAGCNFLKHCKEHPEDVVEPEWYAMLSIVSRLKRPGEDEAVARAKCHEYSKDHPNYDEHNTDAKIDHAIHASGPRMCANIETMFDGCTSCPNYKKVPTPICIKSDGFIATADSGFYMAGRGGALIPQFEDLRRHYDKAAPYRVNSTSGAVYTYDGRRYVQATEIEMRNFADANFDPKPKEAYVAEFTAAVTRTNIVRQEWFQNTTAGKINFKNGTLDTKTKLLTEHTPAAGFLYCLPFDFDPLAKCPTFDKFMDDVTLKDEHLQSMLLEFVGYGICDREYWLQRALLLVGEGSNGKSTFLDVVKLLAGGENTSVMSLSDLQQATERHNLEGKLINVSDEMPDYGFKSTEIFKKLMGGEVTTRRLYQNAVGMKNNTKFIFACNELPSTNDVSHGMLRRMAIVPFTATFRMGDNADPYILDKMRGELSGIFNRVYKHYRELKKRGNLIESITSAQELERYKEGVDRVGTWIKETLRWNGKWDDTVGYVKINDVFENYHSDCKRSEEKPVSKYNFTKHIRRQLDHFNERYVRRAEGDERPYVLRGVWFDKDKTKGHDRY